MSLFPSLKEGAGGEQGGWRQVSCINTLSGSGSPQGALGCSSRSALSSHNPHDNIDVTPVFQLHLTVVFVESYKLSSRLAGMGRDLWDVAHFMQIPVA